jgi:hypothetical protein
MSQSVRVARFELRVLPGGQRTGVRLFPERDLHVESALEVLAPVLGAARGVDQDRRHQSTPSSSSRAVRCYDGCGSRERTRDGTTWSTDGSAIRS